MYNVNQALYWYRTDNPGSLMHDSAKTVVIADEHDYLWNKLPRRRITDEWVWQKAFRIYVSMGLPSIEAADDGETFRIYGHYLKIVNI